MNKLWAVVKRYKLFILLFVINIIILLVSPQLGRESVELTKANLMEMISVIPPIFLLLGLLDVWIERETMVKYMGDKSGLKGSVIAFIMGSAAAGPLYAAFPIAAILIKKGVRFLNVFIFIGAWSTTKIPMILFESTSLGWQFMSMRLIGNIVGIISIAIILEKTMTPKDKNEIQTNVCDL